MPLSRRQRAQERFVARRRWSYLHATDVPREVFVRNRGTAGTQLVVRCERLLTQTGAVRCVPPGLRGPGLAAARRAYSRDGMH